MCTGFEWLLPILGGGAALASSLAAPKPAAPPAAPAVPATQADAARTAGATVRVGDGKDDDTTAVTGVANTSIAETRVFGKPVGGLGKSGLTI